MNPALLSQEQPIFGTGVATTATDFSMRKTQVSRRGRSRNRTRPHLRYPVFETGVATDGHLIFRTQIAARASSSTRNRYDRELDDKRKNMTSSVLRTSASIVNVDFTTPHSYGGRSTHQRSAVRHSVQPRSSTRRYGDSNVTTSLFCSTPYFVPNEPGVG